MSGLALLPCPSPGGYGAKRGAVPPNTAAVALGAGRAVSPWGTAGRARPSALPLPRPLPLLAVGRAAEPSLRFPHLLRALEGEAQEEGASAGGDEGGSSAVQPGRQGGQGRDGRGRGRGGRGGRGGGLDSDREESYRAFAAAVAALPRAPVADSSAISALLHTHLHQDPSYNLGQASSLCSRLYTYLGRKASKNPASARWKEALEVHRQLVATGVRPNAYAYNGLILLLGKAGQWEAAFRVFKEMKDGAVAPDPYTWTALMTACGVSQEWRLGDRVFREALSHESAAGRLTPELYNSYFELATRRGEPDILDKALTDMLRRGIAPNRTGLRVLVECFSEAKQPERVAKAVLAAADGGGEGPDPRHVEAGLAACGELDMKGEAERIFQAFKTDRVGRPVPLVYTGLMAACEKFGDWGRAVALFEDLKLSALAGGAPIGSYFYNKALAAVARNVYRGAPLDLCFELYREMLAAGVEPPVFVFSTLIIACASAGDVERGFWVQSEMRRHNAEPTVFTWSGLLKCCEEGKDLPRAMHTFAEMIKEGKVKPNAYHFNCLVACCEKVGEVDKAFEVLDLMKRRGYPPDVYTCSSVIAACRATADVDRALGVLNMMEVEGIKPNQYTFTSLIGVCEKAMDVDRAFDVLTKMKALGSECAPNVVTYSSLMMACESRGEHARAFEVFDEMLAAGVAPNEFSFNALASACENAGDWERARGILATMAEFDIVPTMYTYTSVISAAARAGRLDAAEGFFKELDDQGLVVDSYPHTALMGAAVRVGEHARAIDLWSDMLVRGLPPSAAAVGLVCRAHAARGSSNMVLNVLDRASASYPEVLAEDSLWSSVVEVLWDGANEEAGEGDGEGGGALYGGGAEAAAAFAAVQAALGCGALRGARGGGAHVGMLEGGVSIDLHELSVGAAKCAAVNWLFSQILPRVEGGPAPPAAYIITGQGNHSRRGEAKLRDQVAPLLAALGMAFAPAEGNPGMLVCDGAVVQRALSGYTPTLVELLDAWKASATSPEASAFAAVAARAPLESPPPPSETEAPPSEGEGKGEGEEQWAGADLASLTVAVLRERAKAAGIKGGGRMKKAELVAALQLAEA